MMNHALRCTAALVTALAMTMAGTSRAEQVTRDAGPYIPSPTSVVSDMLTLAGVGAKDFVIDLGSGDGRIVLTAAKVFGASGFGVEIKDNLVKQANEAARQAGVSDRARFITRDLFKTDVSQASVLTMYLLPDTVDLLRAKLLRELRPGARVISHDYPLTGWSPKRYVQMDLEEKVKISGVTTTLIYLYVMPERVAGSWSLQLPTGIDKAPARLELVQTDTPLAGHILVGERRIPLRNAALNGNEIGFIFEHAGRQHRFSGTVKGNAMEGIVEGTEQRTRWRATRTGAG